VFKMTPSGTVTLLHSFSGSNGSMPIGALVQASDGNLYGTCYSGGANGWRTAFRISTKGTFTKIYAVVFHMIAKQELLSSQWDYRSQSLLTITQRQIAQILTLAPEQIECDKTRLTTME